jgi:hypothetical protein
LSDPLDDVLVVGVLLDQANHTVNAAIHDLMVVLTALRECFLSVRHQQLLIETGRGQIEQ